MTEEIIIDGIDVSGCEYYHKVDSICDNENNHNVGCGQYDTCTYKQLKRLEQENKEQAHEIKSLYDEKNSLHTIIDRLLENAGYSKDIASAEDFEDVYEDMQIKRNELIELEQENKELKEHKVKTSIALTVLDRLKQEHPEIYREVISQKKKPTTNEKKNWWTK